LSNVIDFDKSVRRIRNEQMQAQAIGDAVLASFQEMRTTLVNVYEHTSDLALLPVIKRADEALALWHSSLQSR
jgi:hypothetical protein